MRDDLVFVFFRFVGGSSSANHDPCHFTLLLQYVLTLHVWVQFSNEKKKKRITREISSKLYIFLPYLSFNLGELPDTVGDGLRGGNWRENG